MHRILFACIPLNADARFKFANRCTAAVPAAGAVAARATTAKYTAWDGATVGSARRFFVHAAAALHAGRTAVAAAVTAVGT